MKEYQIFDRKVRLLSRHSVHGLALNADIWKGNIVTVYDWDIGRRDGVVRAWVPRYRHGFVFLYPRERGSEWEFA